MKEELITAKPFLKWAGGKRQLLNTFSEIYPEALKQGKIKNYYEPFVGGGAVFFDLVQNYHIENAFLYDINEELILTYKVIQKDVGKLIKLLGDISVQYLSLDDEQRKQFYYKVRDEYNQQRFDFDYASYSEDWIQRVAQIIFINKTCFNGLFRFNLKGGFNTPVGSYKNPTILDDQNLQAVSKVLENVTIKRAGFEEVRKDIQPNSFVYFDPPYRPISQSSRFTSYSKYAFANTEQIQLAQLFKDLDKDGYLLMLSNSDPKNTDPNDDFFENHYAGFNIQRVEAKRAINSKASKRTAIKELVITNY